MFLIVNYLTNLVERSRNTVLLTSTQAAISGTTQYSARSVTKSLSGRVRAVGPTSRAAHSFGSDKLYICLSNKCFNCIQCICCVTDVRPSQDHRMLRVQTVQINLVLFFFYDSFTLVTMVTMCTVNIAAQGVVQGTVKTY